MDIDSKNQTEEITLLNVQIYAIDEYGICHLFETDKSNQSQSILIHNEEKMDVSKSIVALSNQIDSSLQLINHDFIQNSSNFQSTEYLSTQPFSIFDFHENSISSSLHLFNNDMSTPVLSPPLQLSGHIAPQYQDKILIDNNENIFQMKQKKKKKKRKLRYPSRQFLILKSQFKAYMKKKKKKEKQEEQLNNISNVILPHQSQQIESSPMEHLVMTDLQLSPDLSKRKYIYKDITLSNNNNTNQNQNQMNWRIFQCTQQPSSISCFDQTVTNDRNYYPLHCANNPTSLPDIRIGLSRHHSTKHLHKTIID